MTTTAELIASSLRKIGILAAGQPLSDSQFVDGLDELNDILENWSTEGLTVYAQLRQTFTVTGRQFTIGPSGQLNGVRPIKVLKAELDGEPLRVSSIYDDVGMHYETGQPLGRVTLPCDVVAAQLSLWCEVAMPTFSEPEDELMLVLPAGYRRALKYALAVASAPDYGADISPIVAEIAQAAKADIKRVNMRASILKVDPALC